MAGMRRLVLLLSLDERNDDENDEDDDAMEYKVLTAGSKYSLSAATSMYLRSTKSVDRCDA